MKKQVYNPYLPSYEYVPDGEPRIFDGRLYLYGSHDRFGGSYYCENDYVCWSAPLEDMSDWRYEGIIYRKAQDPHEAEHHVLFAPDVIQGVDGRYYLYYSAAHTSILSVAVCETPAGQYRYYGDIRNQNGDVVGDKSGDFYQFDPGVFLDDDNRIYLYSGFCPKDSCDEKGRIYVGAHVSELEEDMLTIKKGPDVLISRDRKCPEGARFFEASSVRKINGRYYFVYSARNDGLHYYYSDYPDCGFQYGGRIHSTSDVGINGYTQDYPAYPNGNTHGGLVNICGQYYIFNHRQTNRSSFSRQGVAEPVFIEADGKIRQVESTSCGLNGGPLRGYGRYPAYIACNLLNEKEKPLPCITQDGEDRECGPDQYLKAMGDGCVAGYKYFNLRKLTSVSLTLRGRADGVVRIFTDLKKNPIGETPIHLDSSEWITTEIPVVTEAGVHPLYIRYDGAGNFDLSELTLIR